MRFYTISDPYITYLKTIDSKVPDNYSGKRPYIGVLLEVGGHEYLAPLTSYKPKQDSLAANLATIFKLHEKGNESNKLGMLLLNNMVPVVESEIAQIDIAMQDAKYRNLLTLQLDFINSKQDPIKAKAAKLHKLITVNKHQHFCRLSCDFSLLELHYVNFGK
ncbi:MAG: hypothetical protein RL748_2151 [Pseudomonadota bacterium]|jgi:protein AbiQ